jgi:undecaprenyl-diphosphatase
MLSLDVAATRWVNGLSGIWNPLDLVLLAITWAGVPVIVLAVALQWWIRVDRRGERHAAIACGLSFLLGLFLNQVIILFVDRMRPYDAGVTHLLIAPSTDSSFPSDHATAVSSIFFAYLLHRRFRKALLFAIAGSLVAFSRIYVGTHYVGDILGGLLTGLFAALIVRAIYARETRLDRWVTGIL